MRANFGYIERSRGGYVGELNIDGVDISPISAVYFKDNGTHWLWLKRKKIMEYSFETGEYTARAPSPAFEAYLVKAKSNQKEYAYKGDFVFFRFKYTIFGVWDEMMKKTDRLNLYIERKPIEEQNILKRLNAIKNGEQH